MIDKPQIRQLMRQRRQQQNRRTQQTAAQQLLKNGKRLLRGQKVVACFVPFDGEPDISALQSWLLRTRNVALPRINRQKKVGMQFVRCSKNSKLSQNRFGIAEPVATRRLRLNEIDVILLPLTAFDKKGHRLGMGAGFYDRALSSRRARLLRKPKLIGVAFYWQEMASLPSDPWDLPLHAVLTDKQIIHIKC